MNRALVSALIAVLLAPPLSSTATAAKPKLPPEPAPELPRPALGEAPKFVAPVPVRIAATAETPEIFVLPRRELPLVTITAVVRAGSALDPTDHPGLASAVSTMLQDGGAGTRTAPQLAEAFEALGDELTVECDPDGVRLSLTTLSRNLPTALSLIADLLAHPRFDAGEWTRVRARRIAEILKQRDEPRTAGELVFRKVVFGAHPYGSPVLGTRASVEAMTDADLRAFHAKRYGPRTTSVILAGDVAPEAAPKLVAGAFGSWRSDAALPVVPAAPERAKALRLVLVDRPGAPQSDVRVGEIGIDRASTDYAAAHVVATILGGSFTSRLNQNLREKHGYTYGASSRFGFWSAPGPFVARSAVRTDVTGPALAELLAELRGISAIRPEEAAKGRALVAHDVVEAFSTGSGAANLLVDVALHGLPTETWSKLPELLAPLDAAKLVDAARRLIHPDALTIVIIGDRKVVEPQLRKLPVGNALEIRDVDGNAVK